MLGYGLHKGGTTRRAFLRGAGAAACCLACAGVAPLAGCGAGASQELQTTVFCFDTVCTLRGVMSQATLDEAVSLCQRFEDLFSRTIEGSDVWRINSAGGAPVTVADETADLVAQSPEYSEASGGLFDVTIGAVSSLWDFKNEVVPAPEDVARALPHVGYHNLLVSGNQVTLADPDARIDLGGIAKGYIADRLCDLFAERGVTSAFVNLGGNVKVMGGKPDGSSWSVGVQDPAADAGESLVAKLQARDGSVVTSGLYERCFTKDGRTYWHILDPRTGYPVETSVRGATVYSAASIDGDGYTKPLFMMAPADAIAWLEGRGDVQGLLVLDDGQVLTTAGSDFELVQS